MATSLDLQRLNDEASDWFYRNAEVIFRLQRGPDLQWCLDADGNFQVWTTEQLTPGREEYCLTELLHDDDVLQSIYFCEEFSTSTRKLYEKDGIQPVHDAAFYAYSVVKNSGPLDRSTVYTRRYEGHGSMLIISTKTESFGKKIPDHLIHSFAAAQTKTEENVTFLSHFINTV